MWVAAIEDAEYREEKISFWDNVYGFDMTAIKKLALHEPLVDTVEASSIASSACEFRSIDLNTVTVADLTFKVPFRITCQRTDNVHALVWWFDTTFGACHKPITFSTGPHAPYTHWKQTVFYLQDPVPVSNGDVIEGTIDLAPNAKNERDLDIEIDYKLQGEQVQAAGAMKYRMC